MALPRKPHARVAQYRSDGIPEGDGAPVSHTQHAAQPDRKVTTDHPYSGPRPFAASPLGTVLAVIAMSTVVLTMTVTALVVVLDGDPNRWTTIGWSIGGLASWCVVLSIPAALRKRPPALDQRQKLGEVVR